MPSSTQGANASSTTDYEELGYDANGNVTSRRNRAGETISFTFDALDRPTLKNLPGTEPDVSYAYDLLGRMTSASQTGHALSFGYDALGRQLTQTSPHGTISSTFDLAGRRTRIEHPDGMFFDQDFLVTGEMTKIRENGATSGIGVLATFAYDDRGRRTSLTYGNGTSTSYSYDSASRLLQLTQDISGTGYDQTLSFTYNAASQIASNTRSNDAYAFTAHLAGATSTVNGLNQLTQVGGTNTSHDDRGNMTNDGSRTYAYSSENLLTSSTGGGVTTTLGYDPLMRLVSTSGGLRFVHDGADLALEYNSAGALIRRYVHGPGIDEPLVWYVGNGTAERRFMHADERGSIAAVSKADGTIWNVRTYDENGQPGPWNSGTFQFGGVPWIGEVGLYYHRARMRHPGLDRFMQTDPIGYDDGLNMYAYVHGDPVNAWDPTGLCPVNSNPCIVTGRRDRDDNSRGSNVGGFFRVWIQPGMNVVGEITGTRAFATCLTSGTCSGRQWAMGNVQLAPPARVIRVAGIGVRAGRGLIQRTARRGCGCFEAGTLVMTPDGLRPIGEIAVGDLVMAMNEETGEVAARAVTDLIRPEPKPLYRLEALDGGGEAETSTPPTTIRGWSAAAAGSRLRSSGPATASTPPAPRTWQ